MSHTQSRQRPEAILIAGPTASGKSALALQLARRLGGRVINADSMQVYRDLSLLTARPTEAEMAEVPHALYGKIDGATNHSVSLWLDDARGELSGAQTDGMVPIFVGGSGLYFKALTQGLSDIPRVPDRVRAEVRAWAADRDASALHDELSQRDPQTAMRLRPSDPQRILRALEVHIATGQGLSSFQGQRAAPVVDLEAAAAITLSIDRELLRSRVDLRFERMISQGVLDEVRRLADRQLDPALPVMRAIGVPPFLRHLAGTLALEAAIADAKAATRQYIKRQQTFMRHQLPAFHPVAVDLAEASVLAAFQSS